ncbi:sulfate adenylyltransferase, partial [Nitrospinae bacterium AH-259-F20]|nr:sulfate adenylyltransferase [Nitrospinae bacterium AH-259-F20]
MHGLIAPHGGELVDRVLEGEERDAAEEQAADLPQVALNARAISDLELIATGAFSPLEGFMNRETYLRVVKDMRLSDGLPWSLPITLAVDAAEAERLKPGHDVALLNPHGDLLAVLHLEEAYPYDKQEEARLVYRTEEDTHPGVLYLYQRGDVLLAGPVSLVRRSILKGFEPYSVEPRALRRQFADRGWRTIVAFQTRNPIHRAHEYIQKCALELMDGLLVHPLVGRTKLDDVPNWVRLECYRVLLENYYPKERALLTAFPGAMRYAGPREAIFHALVRKNYGCTHFIVGRDHAGVGSYYGTYDAQHIFGEFDRDDLGITPLFFEHTFYCEACGAMASPKTCP